MTDRTRRLIVAAAVVVLLIAAGSLLIQRIPPAVSAPLFLLVVVIEVVIAPIPGGAVGYLGAARFGFEQAWPLLYIGNVIGTTLVFFLARRFGTPIFEENVAPKTRARYDDLLENHPFLLWLVYSVPLVPVDVLSVLAGLSRMPARRFFLIAFTGYILYTGIVAYVGSSVAELIGVMEAMSILGGILLVALLAWLWRGHRRRRRTLYRVGLTGSIASGKSEVARRWRELGAVVIDADQLAREAVEQGTEGLRRVTETFGAGVLAADGTLDRAALRRVVFRDPGAREQLERIVHPEVARLRLAAEREAAAGGARIVAHDIPLLFETGMQDEFDVVVVVDAPEELRLRRLVEMRGLDDAEARRMIEAQLPAEEKRARAAFVIENAGSLQALRVRADEVWRELERRAG